MIELTKDEMSIIRPLCTGKDDVVLRSSLEGNLGTAWVNNKANPQIAVIVAADFCYLLGETSGNLNDLPDRNFLENCRNKIIIVDGIGWVSIIQSCFPGTFKQFNRYKLKFEFKSQLKDQLLSFAKLIEPNYQIISLDESIYKKALTERFTEDFCCFFSSFDEFQKHGIGFLILKNDEIISGASSYTYCSGCIEITIGTKPDYRRKGLALACASKLILDCMDQNIIPHWDAANLQSVALAEKLGYTFDKEYTVYSI